MKVFLTGGTGFIGSYVAVELAGRGHEVTILARNPEKVPGLGKIDGIEIVRGDVTDTSLTGELVSGKDACVLVALNYKAHSGAEVLQDDTFPTAFIADAAAKSGVKQLIYTSSTATNDFVYMIEQVRKDGSVSIVHSGSKAHPTTFYGATKAASEIFLLAGSYQSEMRVNFIRPGYTFGNPVVPGANVEGDTRFRSIVADALRGEPVTVVKNDGTQFIWAGHLAKLYSHVLEGDINRKTYFGLSRSFISWERIAREAIKRTNSTSKLVVEDRGWNSDVTLFDVSDMKADFGLEFDPWDNILDHLDYYISTERSA